MLVLSRKLNQKLQIGNDIVVTVVKVKGNVIRLGIEAPRDVRVIRSELEIKVDNSLTADLLVGDDASSDSGVVNDVAGTIEGTADEPGARSSQSKINANKSGSIKSFRSSRSSANATTRSSSSSVTRNQEDSPLCHRRPITPSRANASRSTNMQTVRN